MPRVWYHWLGPAIPLVLLSVSIAIYSLALGSSRQKWLWLVPLLCSDYLALAGSTYWPKNGIDSLWGLLICIWTSHSLSILFLEDRTLVLDGQWIFEKQNLWWKSWTTWNNPRLLLTSRAENRSPPPLRKSQSRLAFTAGRLAKLGLYWILTYKVQPLILPGPFMPLYAADFDGTRQNYFRRMLLDQQHPITMRETLLRAIFAFFWAAAAYVMVDGAHIALSLLFVVVLRVNRPDEWPPIYGNLRKAYSLRGFWGQFWHRLVVIPYGNVGKLLAGRCLGLGPESMLYKLIVACSIFVLSGVAHAVVARQLGDVCWYLDIWWFFLNFVASAVETFVCSKLSRQTGVCDAPYSQKRWFLRSGIVCQCFGFAWVFLFFFWSVPKWQYPKIYSIIMELSNTGENNL